MSVLQERIRTYRDTHANEYKLQHDFAALHGLCMLKVSTIYVLVVEVTRHNIRNVLGMKLLSQRSTVSRFLEDLQSTVSCVCCKPSHSNEHHVPEKGENLGKNINYSSVICFKSSCYRYMSAGIRQEWLVLTNSGFNLFILLVEIAFSLVAFLFRLFGSCCYPWNVAKKNWYSVCVS